MTTENVAILFTDIVGSTELSQRLSAEDADEVRRGHFAVLRQAVAESGGTEVKSLGDGLMIVFASASAALMCAVAMQQGVEQNNRGEAEAIGLRVGVSMGEVSREEGDYFGDPVVEAARLCAVCESGQVLATDVLRLIAGRRSRIECLPVGGLELKGLPGSVETVEVLWEPVGGSIEVGAIPLPGRLAIRPDMGVVGRDAEAESVADTYKRVAGAGGREVVLVSGEPGLGKTTLVAEASRTAFDAGAMVLFGHCEEDLATPYQLFAEALGHYVTHAPEDQLLAHVAAHGSELARLVPALASRLPDLPSTKATDADTERFLLFAAVVGLFATTSEHRPIVLVFDDLQWADKGSLFLLRHLAGSDVPMRLLILGTYRDSELSHADALIETLAALRRLNGVARIDLDGLDDAGVIALMEAAAGYELDDDAVGLAHAISRETDGNPFFVSEVLRNLVENGTIAQNEEGRWVAEESLDAIALPDSVREVIGARVLRSGKDAERVLSVAAVIGRDFDLDLLARATKTSEDDLLDILDDAAVSALVREVVDTGRYSFAHALIQHTLYEDLGHNRRARAHRQVAEALEDLCNGRPGARIGELARHWIAATHPIDLTKAVDYTRQAGDAALAALAPADALRYYAQALDLYLQATDPDPVLGLDLAIGLGTAQRQTGDPAFRETLLGAARRAADLDDAERLVAAVLANNRGFLSTIGAIDAEQVEVLEMALDRLPTDCPERALVLATLCSELLAGSTHERRQSLADEAISIAKSSGDDAITLRVLNSVLLPLLVPSQLEPSLARTADALLRAGRVGDPVQLYWAACWRGDTTARAGDIDEMDGCIEIMGSLAEQLDQPMFNWVLAQWHATRALIAGDTERAEQWATEALQIGADSGQPDAAVVFGMQFMMVSLQRGTLGELIPLIERRIAESSDVSGIVAAILAVAYVEADRTQDAARLLKEFAGAEFDLPMGMVWLTAMVDFADAAIECRDPRYAGLLFDQLAPWADHMATTGTTAEGPVSHYVGGLATVLGRYDDADAYFAKSAAFSDRIGAKFFAARTDLLWGRMLAERGAPGDIEKALRLLADAQMAGATHGYENVERRASAALERLNA
ncbi:MAG TPA: AAA family ATPase [Acidimicrobiales bacterium]|nr:AAA family ATPase [Acidimicrobiales bacterium]